MLADLAKARPRHPRAIWWLLAAGLGVRLIGIGYGLPLDLVPDESALIFGSTAMLQLKTLIPALNPAGFAHLHYPPIIAYLNLIAFAPVLAVQYLMGDFGSLEAFKAHLATHPHSYWIPARLVQVGFGTATLWLVYQLGRRLGGIRTGLFAALFLALSFNHVVLSHLAKQWAVVVWFMALIVHLALSRTPSMSRMAGLGALCGLAFGANVVGLLSWGLLAGIFVYRQREQELQAWRDGRLWISASTCVAVAAGCIALHWSYFAWLFTQGMGSNISWTVPKSLGGYAAALISAGRVLILQEPLALGFGLAGAWALWLQRRRAPLVGIATWTWGYLTFLYTSAHLESRLLLPLLPALCLLAGYGLDATVERLSAWRPALARLAVAAVIASSLIPVLRVDWLLIQPDTRLLAKTWLEREGQGAVLIMSSGTSGVQVRRNAAALAAQASRGRLGSGEAARLERQSNANEGLFAVNVQDWHPEYQNVETVRALLARYGRAGEAAYFVVTYISPEGLSALDQALMAQGRLVRRFDNGYGLAAIGHHFSGPVTALFRLARLGAIVEIYELPHPTHALAGGAIGERP